MCGCSGARLLDGNGLWRSAGVAQARCEQSGGGRICYSPGRSLEDGKRREKGEFEMLLGRRTTRQLPNRLRLLAKG